MLNSLLQTCGLNSTERQVFLYLFERGESIASLTAKHLQLKRTTVYAALDALIHYGIVVRKKRGKVSYFNTLQPDMVAKVLEGRARQSFEEIHSAAHLLRIELQQLLPKKQDFGGFEISTVESLEAVYHQLAQTLVSGDFSSWFNPQKSITTERFRKLVNSFLIATAKSGAHIREILVAGPTAEWYKSHIKNPNHHIKEIGPSQAIFSDVILVNDYLILNNYDPKNEVGLKIREKGFHDSLLTIFNWMWDRL